MESDEKKGGSVFDILYSDTRRLSSLLSQFSDDGLAVEMVRVAEESTSTQIGLNVKIVKADGTEIGKTSSTTRMDPQWLLPLLFLDSAQELIHRDIEAAPIGSLVLSTGRLIVTDLTILKEMWKSATMKKFILEKMTADEQEGTGNRQARRRGVAVKAQKNVTDQEMALELLPLLPHSPQVNIVTDEFAVWATIDAASLFGTVSDIMLKHGSKVAGSWSMVSILDARPFEAHEDETDHDYDDIMSFMEQLRIGMTTDNIWKIATELAQPARQALGRPFLSYGVTPLIIFREIETRVGSVG